MAREFMRRFGRFEMDIHAGRRPDAGFFFACTLLLLADV